MIWSLCQGNVCSHPIASLLTISYNIDRNDHVVLELDQRQEYKNSESSSENSNGSDDDSEPECSDATTEHDNEPHQGGDLHDRNCPNHPMNQHDGSFWNQMKFGFQRLVHRGQQVHDSKLHNDGPQPKPYSDNQPDNAYVSLALHPDLIWLFY